MRIGRRSLLLVLGALLAGLAWSFQSFWTAATAPAAMPTPHRVDAIVVLTGGAERVKAGVDLLAAGQADRLFISGAHETVVVADIMAQQPNLAADLSGRIELGRARDTAENARETAEWAAANGVASLTLVTAYYHMPRSLALLHAAAPGLAIWPAPVEPLTATRAGWWRSPRGIALILGEWLKYLATRAGLAT